jgi:hypothetical protein
VREHERFGAAVRITEVIVTKIAELAKAGERDPEILCGKVLADLEAPAESVTERAPPAERAGTASAVANEGSGGLLRSSKALRPGAGSPSVVSGLSASSRRGRAAPAAASTEGFGRGRHRC